MKKRFISRRNFVQGLTCVTAFSPLASHFTFSETTQTSEPGLILGTGPRGRCDDFRNGAPIVRWHPQDQQWWMWYYCRSHDFPKNVASGFGTGSMALAKSKEGLHWQHHEGHLKGGAIMEPNQDDSAFDSQHIGCSDILYHQGEWILFYWAGDSSVPPAELGGYPVNKAYQEKGSRCRVGVAKSKDGIHWNRITGSATGGASVDIEDDIIYAAFPSAVHDGERFIMHYTVLSTKAVYWETRIAVSTNLVDWQPMGTLNWLDAPKNWEPGGMATRQILPHPQNPEQWLMIYVPLDARFSPSRRTIAAAISEDALHWRHLHEQPFFLPGPVNKWDGGGVASPQLVEIDDQYHLYYYGFADKRNLYSPRRGIGLAISQNKDLNAFLRVNI